MRGRQDPHVHRHLARLADRAHGLLLDHAQQLHLHVQRQVRDLVQEQRAALGRADQALLVRHGAGERALLVPEQLALHELRRDRPAIDRHERSITSRARRVDQPGHQLLAGAGVAGDVHRGLAACHLGDHLSQLLHRPRLAEQLERRRRHDRLGLVVRRAVVVAQFQGRRDQLAQRDQVERLGQEVEGAELERAHRGLDVAVRRDHGHGHAGPVLLDPLHDVEAIAVGQAHVGEHEVETPGAEAADRGSVVARSLDFDLHATQRQRQQLANVRFVVDDQRAGRRLSGGGVHSFHRRGSANMTRKMLPPPGRGS